MITAEFNPQWLRAVAAVFALAVGVGLFAAWSYVVRIVPHLVGLRGRTIGILPVMMTAGFAVVTSSWLNAAALVGAAAREQHLLYSFERFEQLANAPTRNVSGSDKFCQI